MKPKSNEKVMCRNTITIVLVLMVSIVWCIVIPFIVANYVDKVSSVELIKQKVHDVDATNAFNRQKLLEDKIQDYLGKLSRGEISGSRGRDEKASLELYENAASYNKVQFRPFDKDKYAFVWVVSYVSLGILVFMAFCDLPTQVRLRIWGYAAIGAVLLMAFIEFPHQYFKHITNTYELGRMTFAYLNKDIGMWSFILEEVRTFGFFLFVSFACVASHYISRKLNECEPMGKESDLAAASKNLTDQLSMWQVRILLLAAAFIPWTYFFWSTVGKDKDERFILVGVLVHIVWAAAAWSISRPLQISFNSWLAFRALLVQEWLIDADIKGGCEAKLQLLEAVTPISEAGFVSATGVVVVAVLSPLAGLFI